MLKGMPRRGAALVVVTACLLTMTASPAAAAPPVNDTLAGAVAIGSVPFTYSQSTTEAAQTDDFETSLNELCGAPVVEHGVWFTGTTAISGSVNVDVSGSDFAAGIMAFEGTPTPESLIGCGPDELGPLPAGTDLTLLVFGDGLTEATAGNLVLNVTQAPPPLLEDVTVDPVARVVAKSGEVTITGTVTCREPTPVFQDILVVQRAGRLTLSAFAFVDVACDGVTPWSTTLSAENGIFKGGRATVEVFSFSLDDESTAEVEATVQLKGSSFKQAGTAQLRTTTARQAASGYTS